MNEYTGKELPEQVEDNKQKTLVLFADYQAIVLE